MIHGLFWGRLKKEVSHEKVIYIHMKFGLGNYEN